MCPGKLRPLEALLPPATAAKLRRCASAAAAARRCVYGVEANPRWSSHLLAKERRARRQGVRVKVFTGTAIDTADGRTSFFVERRAGPAEYPPYGTNASPRDVSGSDGGGGNESSDPFPNSPRPATPGGGGGGGGGQELGMVLLPEAGTIALRPHAEALGAPRHVVAAAALAAVAARHAREDDVPLLLVDRAQAVVLRLSASADATLEGLAAAARAQLAAAEAYALPLRALLDCGPPEWKEAMQPLALHVTERRSRRPTTRRSTRRSR